MFKGESYYLNVQDYEMGFYNFYGDFIWVNGFFIFVGLLVDMSGILQDYLNWNNLKGFNRFCKCVVLEFRRFCGLW